MPNNRISILSNAARAELRTEPYPFLVIEDALDSNVFEQLAREYPAPSTILDGRQKKDTWFDYPACKAIENPAITPFWKQFMHYHVSTEFYQDILTVFGDAICQLYPNLETEFEKPLENLQTAMRWPEKDKNERNRKCDLSMECQFYINYTEKARAVRGPHIDRPTELYAALLYFREDGDDSTGSDLQVCSAKTTSPIYPARDVIRADKLPMEIDMDKVDVVRTATYKANTLVFFVNSAKSLHAVSPRTATPIPRKHINFTGDLFNVPNNGLFRVKHSFRNASRKWMEEQPLIWRLAHHI